ncbi:MAG: hypothetical protein ABF876_17390 [Acetobacter aceti]
MMPTIDISDDTNARLQKIAKPLVDTYDTVIARLLESHENATSLGMNTPAPGTPLKDDGRTMLFDWTNPPALAHTTVTQVSLNGELFPKSECYWNTIMVKVIQQTRKFGKSAAEILDLLFVNAKIGQETENGFKFLHDVGLSVQGQDSNAAFRQAFELANKMGFKLEVHFRWQPNEKALHPNRNGLFDL